MSKETREEKKELLQTQNFTQQFYERLKWRNKNHRRRGFRRNSAAYQWYRKQNWKELREEFCFKVQKNGEYFYPSVSAYIRAKWRNLQEQKWARWVIGAQPNVKMPWEGNWALERFMDHWRQDLRVQSLAEKLASEVKATQLGHVTADFYVDFIGRILSMQQQLDEYYKGQLFLEGLPEKKNLLRFRRYLNITDRLMDMLEKARRSVVKSVAGSSEALVRDSLEALQQRVVAQGGQLSGVDGMLGQLIQVAKKRAELFGTPMPELTDGTGLEKVKTITMKKAVDGSD